jgi:uncharacterized protein YbaP (TraB family)
LLDLIYCDTIIIAQQYDNKHMTKKKGTVVYLSDEDKARLENIAANWGISQSSAVQRLVREFKLG